MSTAAKRKVWREVLDEAYRIGDGDWELGDGGGWLLDLLLELMRQDRPDGTPPALTDEQVAWALDELARKAGGQ